MSCYDYSIRCAARLCFSCGHNRCDGSTCPSDYILPYFSNKLPGLDVTVEIRFLCDNNLKHIQAFTFHRRQTSISLNPRGLLRALCARVAVHGAVVLKLRAFGALIYYHWHTSTPQQENNPSPNSSSPGATPDWHSVASFVHTGMEQSTHTFTVCVTFC